MTFRKDIDVRSGFRVIRCLVRRRADCRAYCNRWPRKCTDFYASLPPARFARSLAARQRGRLVHEIDRRALAHALGEIERVPVRQPDAAVGVGLADPLRIRRAVDAIAVLGEIDPDHADRIVRAGRDGELALGVDALELEFGIVMVGGVMGDPADLYPPARGRLL